MVNLWWFRVAFLRRGAGCGFGFEQFAQGTLEGDQELVAEVNAQAAVQLVGELDGGANLATAGRGQLS